MRLVNCSGFECKQKLVVTINYSMKFIFFQIRRAIKLPIKCSKCFVSSNIWRKKSQHKSVSMQKIYKITPSTLSMPFKFTFFFTKITISIFVSKFDEFFLVLTRLRLMLSVSFICNRIWLLVWQQIYIYSHQSVQISNGISKIEWCDMCIE